VPDFPYIFGFRREPAARGVEQAHGVMIAAPDRDAAAAWGDRIARHYVSRLYCVPDPIVQYNNWVAEELDERTVADWPRVTLGEFPDFAQWLEADSS
jgi:hypothetical protein